MLDRKNDHLRICLEEEVRSSGANPWDAFRLPHCAAPEIDFREVRLECTFLDRSYSSPFLISCMTGGTQEASQINERLAYLANLQNIPMGLGSLRFALEDFSKLEDLKRLRKKFPKADFWGNLGLVQWNYGVKNDAVINLVEALELRVFVLHLNPLQEAIQQEGNRNFSNLLRQIGTLRKQLPSNTKLVLKETGSGLDVTTGVRAVEEGIDALDVAGLGGTHWGYVEGLRSPKRQTLGEIFRDSGIPAPEALRNLSQALGENFPLIASGGLRHGLDVAKSFYLGAHFAGLALTFLKAAKTSQETLMETFEIQKEALQIACFTSGAKTPRELKNK